MRGILKEAKKDNSVESHYMSWFYLTFKMVTHWGK